MVTSGTSGPGPIFIGPEIAYLRMLVFLLLPDATIRGSLTFNLSYSVRIVLSLKHLFGRNLREGGENIPSKST